MTGRPAPAAPPVVLAIDTATPQVSVALGGAGGPLASIQVTGGRRHGELLAPAIAEVCRLARTPLQAIDAVAVDVGPGLFTGLRVGLATARALVSALGVPGVGLTSLEILANAHRHQRRPVVAVVDARRCEVFWAPFRPGPDGLTAEAPAAVATPETVVAALGVLGDDILVVGDGALRYRDAFAAQAGVNVAEADDAHPSATDAARMAATRLLGGNAPGDAGAGIEPLYLRQPDVRIGWAARPEPVPAPTVERDG
ncbi:MAG: tRNA (adenosine(37)-N6)-threonylcarbamoyltransferase complex dimerization subunit type 1 TsaB [Actinomycetota bacterium]|nr:tRNA (adenosine(37)-N6)-threonylcarbamoyltransferase complex dimerization subunit type 1 TsaB [Actinomycetota bacterium]MDQ6945524.1 tRNA (adenosine(37)-N6)-threonylcarbamoyltransferase complex dimerization subunit type 1 TsaB [Actinomycetota bacterium]